jgi:hypothetical protein
MDGFVTLAVGESFLQRAVLFAISAKRFNYPTTLLYRDADPSPYASHFFKMVDVSRVHLDDPIPQSVTSIHQLKRYTYLHTPEFERCAFCDADSLVIKEPSSVFELGNPVHTPGAKLIADDMRWGVPPFVKSTVGLARQLGIENPIHTLNGGFLVWRRGAAADEWFRDLGRLFQVLSDLFRSRGAYSVRDELCMAFAFAKHGIHLPKSNSSIGVWDASNLCLDIERQVFECSKGYYWEGHQFRPYIAHFGGRRIDRSYRDCAAYLSRRYAIDLPLFQAQVQSGDTRRLRERATFNAFSVSQMECERLADFVRQNNIKSVLEFGPGASTWYFADVGCDVVSLEYDEKWFRRYKQAFQDVPNVRILKFTNASTVLVPELGNRTFDFAFVDSPVGTLYKERSRLNSCEFVAERTSQWMLHDSQRVAERQTLDEFAIRGWRVEPVPDSPKLSLVKRNTLSRDTLRRPEISAVTKRLYNLSHWHNLPKVSCQCITFGRPALLNEAVESFLRQDYPGPKELIILNDHPEVLLHEFASEEVKVINVNSRFRTIGEKRNACCALCSGDIIFPWDDDDISLPWRISFTLEQMTNLQYFKPDRLWYWANGRLTEKQAVAHAMGAWSKSLFDEVGGYPHLQSGQDQAIETLFKASSKRDVRPVHPADIFYLYRFPGTGSYHLSAHGFGSGFEEAEAFVRQNVKPGMYRIDPAWKHDYVTAAAQAVCHASLAEQP